MNVEVQKMPRLTKPPPKRPPIRRTSGKCFSSPSRRNLGLFGQRAKIYRAVAPSESVDTNDDQGDRTA